MTDVMERLAAAKRDVSDEKVPAIDDVWRKLDGAAEPDRRSLRLPSHGGQGRRLSLLRGATVIVTVVAVAAAVLVVGTGGSGPAKAFAGWTPDPSTASTAELSAAEGVCVQSMPRLASLTPVLSDSRGPFLFLVYAEQPGAGDPQGAMIGCIPAIASFVFLGVADNGLAPNALAVSADNLHLAADSVPSAGPQYTLTAGQVGAAVTSVTLALDDGSLVQATVQNGWFAAWWPGTEDAQDADITATTGSSTQPLAPSGSSPSGTSGPTGSIPSN